jgi:hypothetical protein
MKTIEFSICNMTEVSKYVNLSRILTIKDDNTILDIISMFDEEYRNNISSDGIDHSRDFRFDAVYSILQMLWTSKERRFYSDVSVEARTAAPEARLLPLKDQFDIDIPNNSWVVITPDAGC